MGSLINSWLQAHRLSRAIFVAVALAGILLWGLFNRPAPLVSRSNEEGRVISVSEQFAVVELGNGKTTNLYFLPPFPQPGDSVPLIRETYRDGTTLYLVDNDTWQTGIHSNSN